MNAVERLLAHTERVAVFFDEIFQRAGDLDPQTAESIHRRLSTYTAGGPYAPPDFELKVAPERYRKSLSADRLDLLSRWQSEAALDNAISRAVVEAARSKKRHGEGTDLAPRTLEIYCDLLAEREELLDPQRLQSMVRDVVAESLLWGPHAAAVAGLAASLTKALGRLRDRPRHLLKTSDGRPFMMAGGPVNRERDWLSERKQHLQPAIDALHVYAQPPADVGSSPKQKTPADKQPKKRSRKGVGGRRKKYSDQLIREVVAARGRDEKQAAKARHPVPPFPKWLREYCDGHNIDIREMFPPRSTGEAWSIRANRFWKAAKSRLSRAGN